MAVSAFIKLSGITEDIWLEICYELGDDDIIQLSYYILLTAENLIELYNHYNIPKNGFIALRVIQLIEAIAIVHISSLFDALKVIGAVFCVDFCALDIGC